MSIYDSAVEFITQLDEIFFPLAVQGYVGKTIKAKAQRVEEVKYEAIKILKDPSNPSAGWKRRGVKLHLILAVTWLGLVAAWIVVVLKQSDGVYNCQSLAVQFEDDFVSSLGSFSGIYDLDASESHPFQSNRVRYIDRISSKAVFAYCAELSAWTLGFAEDGNFPDPCEDWVGRHSKVLRSFYSIRSNVLSKAYTSICFLHAAHSSTTETFDILETADDIWYVEKSVLGGPIGDFAVSMMLTKIHSQDSS